MFQRVSTDQCSSKFRIAGGAEVIRSRFCVVHRSFEVIPSINRCNQCFIITLIMYVFWIVMDIIRALVVCLSHQLLMFNYFILFYLFNLHYNFLFLKSFIYCGSILIYN